MGLRINTNKSWVNTGWWVLALSPQIEDDQCDRVFLLG